MKQILALLVSVWPVFWPMSVTAQEEGHYGAEMGRGVLCDTAEQLETYIGLMDDDENALTHVNQQFRDPVACQWGTVVFRRGEVVKRLHHGEFTFDLTRVLVVAARANGEMIRVKPAVAVTFFLVEEGGA